MSRFLITIMLTVLAGIAHAQQIRSDQETITLLITCAAYMEVTAPIDEETVRFDKATNSTLDKADLFVALAILTDKEGALVYVTQAPQDETQHQVDRDGFQRLNCSGRNARGEVRRHGA